MAGFPPTSFFSKTCRFRGCGLDFPTLADLIEHIEDSHIEKDPRALEQQEAQRPPCVALSYISRFLTDAARQKRESLKRKTQPQLSLPLSSSASAGKESTPPALSLTPPATLLSAPSSSFPSSTPAASDCEENQEEHEGSEDLESWSTKRTECATSSEASLSSACKSGGEEKPFACSVPDCNRRYKNVNGIMYHAKNGHSTQIWVCKTFRCRCGKGYVTAQGLRYYKLHFHLLWSAEIIRKMPQ